MGNLFKGVHLLPQSDFEEAVRNNQIDDDVIYVTPEDFTGLTREQVAQIKQNITNIESNRLLIENNTDEIQIIKNNQSVSSSELLEIKNDMSEIILKNIAQDKEIERKVSFTDYATTSEKGIVAFPTWSGFTVSNGQAWLKEATNQQIQAKNEPYIAVSTTKIDLAVKSGLVNNKLSLTDDEKTKAKEWLGISTTNENVVTLDGTQTITGPKTFTEHVYLANADGTVDRISHLNNNFIIHSGATNSAVLNIDEGLEKIYAFNEELAFKSDIAEASGTTVYVDGTAISSLSFSADPQTQINLLAASIDENIDSKVSKAGDTMTGELVVSKGIKFGNNKINSENSGNTLRTYHIENNEEYDILNYTHGGMLTVNNAETPLILQGYDDRPTYVSGSGIMSDLALESDVPTKVSQLIEDSTHRVVTDSEKAAWNAKLDSYTETDPTVPAWAKTDKKPEYEYSEILNTPEKTIQFAEDERLKSEGNLFKLFNSSVSLKNKEVEIGYNIFMKDEFSDGNTYPQISITDMYGLGSVKEHLYRFLSVYNSSTDITDYNGKTILIKGLKPNTKYTISFVIDSVRNVNSEDSSVFGIGVNELQQRKSRTFTTNTDGVLTTGLLLSFVDKSTSAQVQIKDIRLEEGDLDTGYVDYFGPIVHNSSLYEIYQLDYSQTINIGITTTPYTYTNTLNVPVWINFQCQILYNDLKVYIDNVLVDFCRHFASERWSANTSLILNPRESVIFEGQSFQDYTNANLFIIPFKEVL